MPINPLPAPIIEETLTSMTEDTTTPGNNDMNNMDGNSMFTFDTSKMATSAVVTPPGASLLNTAET